MTNTPTSMRRGRRWSCGQRNCERSYMAKRGRPPGSVGEQGCVTRFWLLIAYRFKRCLQEMHGGVSYRGINKKAARMTVRHLEEFEPGYFGSPKNRIDAELRIRTYLELWRYARDFNVLIPALDALIEEGWHVEVTEDGITIT